jgi:UrcA family protein
MALISYFANVAAHKQRKEIVMNIVKKALLIAIVTSSVCTAHIAQANDGASFKLNASELETATGREKLLIRMKSEARKACTARSYSFFQDRLSCRDEVQAQWIDAIGNPALAALIRKGKNSLASAAN